jgi:glycosyltransferase involved in cell wall biosynthesis
MSEQVTVVIPAYNEGARIGAVLKPLIRARKIGLISDIIVVDDGSTDTTAKVVSDFPVCLISLPENRGKGAALFTGVRAAKTDVVIFLDADLVGLKNIHLERLIKPIVDNPKLGMAAGIFRKSGPVANIGNMLPVLSGQRAVRKSWVSKVPGLESSRYGADTLISFYAKKHGIKTVRVYLDHLSHVYKEQKHNFFVGFFRYRLKMYFEIFEAVMGINLKKTEYEESYVPSDTNEALKN